MVWRQGFFVDVLKLLRLNVMGAERNSMMANGTRVTIDREGCISCGVCWSTCPDFFEENPNDNKSQVVEMYRTSGNVAEGSAPENLAAQVRDAADRCPVTVISVEE